MEYISKEEFFKQPKEVQRVFKEYFDQEIILYSYNDLIDYGIFNDVIDETPLLTEGQLRKFIEDKTGDVILFDFDDLGDKHNWYCHMTCKAYNFIKNEDLGTDLLQAYWKVACEIAKEE